MIFPLKELNDYIQSFNQKNGLVSIWGEFGVGKTMFTLQTALLNYELSDLVIYIYTKPNLPLKQINTISHKFTEKKMDNFLLYRILDFSDLYDFILDLEQILINLKNDGRKASFIVIIDSMTNLYQIELRKKSKNKNVILNYKLNQLLATLSYLKLHYSVDILIVNYLRRLKQENQTIEVQSGGKVMTFWLGCSIKIERDKKLNYRKFVLSTKSDTKKISLLSRIAEFGFF